LVYRRFLDPWWFILIKIDTWLPGKIDDKEIHEISYLQAIKIGLYQCIAMIPGVSRSGATIIGGRLVGLSHASAVEYSFLLGIPTILGASAKKMLDYKEHIQDFYSVVNPRYYIWASELVFNRFIDD